MRFVNRKLRGTFGKVSSFYDASRPDYPVKLGDDIIKISKLKKDSKIFDIGCGSGRSMILFANKIFHIKGLDISKNLISIAKKNLLGFSNIKFDQGSFEKSKILSKYNLITCGQAWHWIDPKVGYKKVYDLLENNGYLAIFLYNTEPKKSKFLQNANKIFDKYNRTYSPAIKYSEITEQKLNSSKFFEKPIKKIYYLKHKISPDLYVKLVFTYSWVHRLSKNKQRALKNDVMKLAKKEKEIILPYRFVLLISKKKYQ